MNANFNTSKEIEWMMSKATVTEIVDGFECGKFEGKLPWHMVQKIQKITEDWKSVQMINSYSKTISAGESQEDFEYITITFWANGTISLSYEIKGA